MAMNEPSSLAFALAAGALLGAMFYGGLWWTVRRGVSSGRAALWFLGSMALRTGLARLPATYRFRVEGHSDTSGDAKENLVLSGQRAAAVVRYLVGKGFAAKRFDSEGLGSTRPRVENDTKENRALNRRVEVHILDGLEH